MSFVGSNILAGASGQGGSGYEIERSLRFNNGDSPNLSKTFGAGNRKTWTWSGWIKRSSLGTGKYSLFGGSGTNSMIRFNNDNGGDQLRVLDAATGGYDLITNRYFRDTSAWYHFVVAIDTTQSTAADRVKIYVNGVQETSFFNSSYPTQNADLTFNNNISHTIGYAPGSTYYDGYLADVYFIDGQALAPTDFGETDDNGVWQPKEFAGSYTVAASGTTTSLSQVGWASSDQANIWDGNTSTRAVGYVNNSVGTISFNPPLTNVTKVETYTQPYNHFLNGSSVSPSGSGNPGWYTLYDNSSSPITLNSLGNSYDSNQTVDFYAIRINGTIVNAQTWTPPSGVGLGDGGANSFYLKFADNSSNAALGTDTSGNSNTWTVNNLVATAAGLATANQGMDVVTYTGTASTQSISSLAFQPDLVWLKRRNGAGNHNIQDAVRGASAVLQSDSNGAEFTNGPRVSSFDSNGFTLTSDNGGNTSGGTYVAWCWKAGGAASSNTDGTITSSVSANTSYGFSICTYTGTEGGTFGHGLNAAPKFVMVKRRNTTADWCLWHTSIPNTQYLMLNQTAAANTFNVWGNTSPTSSVVSVSGDSYTGNNGDTYVAYCWSEVAGFSKFGSYTGTGATGHKITTGFKPAWILFKRTDSVSNWRIVDRLRGTASLNAETSEAEQTLNFAINDDGFTINETGNNPNASGGSYIYAAFAAKPDGSVIDSLVDSPSQTATPTDTGAGGEVVSNYATLNPLDRQSTNGTLSNGNLDLTWATATWVIYRATMHVSSGKWYWEVTLGNNQYSIFGIIPTNYAMSTSNNYWIAQVPNAYCFYPYTGNKYDNTSSSSYATADTSASGTVYGMALDLDAGTMTYYKNGVSLGTAFTGISGSFAPAAGLYNQSGNDSYNFGQRAFAYAAPSGYKSLNTANLPEPTIADGSQYFDTKLYTGNSGTTSISSLAFQPNFVWLKGRSQTNVSHQLYDSVRGTSKMLQSDNNTVESTVSGVSAFNSNGFTLGSNGGSNNSGSTYVAWAWDAGDSNTTIAAGSLNSSVYDQSQTWSNSLTSSDGTYAGGQGPTQAFNGVAGGGTDMCQKNSAGGNLTWTFSGLSGSVRVWIGNAGAVVTDGNGTVRGTNVGNGNTFVSLTGDISDYNGSIIITPSSDSPSLGAVEVDGKMLVDSGVSVTNVPSIASTVRANPSAGFSIVSWTGAANATVNHGLNAAPQFVITKSRDNSVSWRIWSAEFSSAASNYLGFDTGAVATFGGTYWGSMTSTTIGLGAGTYDNNSGSMVAYCFAPVEGYSAMGSYTGNANSDGPFVYTGFRPAFIFIKNASLAGSNWIIIDTNRDTYNEADHLLKPNLSNAEQVTTANEVDILSNGFKPKGTDGDTNGSGNTMIYYAVAENPFKNARAR